MAPFGSIQTAALAALCLLAVSALACDFQPSCRPGEKYRVAIPCEGKCSNYILCEDGVPTEKKCGKFFWHQNQFDAATLDCVNKAVDCDWWKKIVSTTTTTTTETPTTASSTAAPTTTPSSTMVPDTTVVPSSSEAPEPTPSTTESSSTTAAPSSTAAPRSSTPPAWSAAGRAAAAAPALLATALAVLVL